MGNVQRGGEVPAPGKSWKQEQCLKARMRQRLECSNLHLTSCLQFPWLLFTANAKHPGALVTAKKPEDRAAVESDSAFA